MRGRSTSCFRNDDAERLFRDGLQSIFALLGVNPQVAPAFGSRVAIDYFPVDRRSTLMEAGRLQRLIELTYRGYTRVMEPYALTYKRRKDGVAREYLYAYDRTGGASGEVGIKTMTNDGISAVKMLEEAFEPRYPVELAKAGEYFGRATFTTGQPRVITRRERPRAIFGRPIQSTPDKPHTLECPYCNKKFKRASMSDSTLNPHKNDWGGQCGATQGYWV
jgi:hypothetical protein